MRWLVVLLAACAPAATTIDAQHPANPKAERGRLAGPPAALRPGVAQTTPAPTAPAPGHHH